MSRHPLDLKNMKKDTQLAIRINDEDRNALNEVAAAIDRPASQIVREAVREKIAELKQEVAARESQEVAAQ